MKCHPVRRGGGKKTYTTYRSCIWWLNTCRYRLLKPGGAKWKKCTAQVIEFMTVSWLQNVTELLFKQDKWKQAWRERALFSPGNKPTWRCCQQLPRCFCRARDKYPSRLWCRRPSLWDLWASRSIPATQIERCHVWSSFRGKHTLHYGKDAQTHPTWCDWTTDYAIHVAPKLEELLIETYKPLA